MDESLRGWLEMDGTAQAWYEHQLNLVEQEPEKVEYKLRCGICGEDNYEKLRAAIGESEWRPAIVCDACFAHHQMLVEKHCPDYIPANPFEDNDEA